MTPSTLSPDRTAWRETVQDIAEKAKVTLPECNGRVEKAVALVLAGDVELLPNGHAKVASQSNGTTNYRIVNGTCDCKDFAQAPSGWYKHRIAAGIHKRAEARFQTPLASVSDDPAETLSDAPDAPPHGIDPRFITYLHGKPFIRDAGLLAMAHARGLVSLKARFLSVTADLALAEAEAVLADGKTCSDCADSTPGNVPPHMKPHFPRMALTRCNARCLRDVLNVGITALEALEGE